MKRIPFLFVMAVALSCLADPPSKSVVVKFFVKGEEYFFREDSKTHEPRSTREFWLNERYDYYNKKWDNGDLWSGLPSCASYYDSENRYWKFNGWKARGKERAVNAYDPVDPDVIEMEADFIEILPASAQYFDIGLSVMAFGDTGSDSYSGTAEISPCGGEGALLFLPSMDDAWDDLFSSLHVKTIGEITAERALARIGREDVKGDVAIWLSGAIKSVVTSSFGALGPTYTDRAPTCGCTFDVTMVVTAESGRSARFAVGTVDFPKSQFRSGWTSTNTGYFKIRYTLPKEFFLPGDAYKITFEVNGSRKARTIGYPCTWCSIELSTELPSARVKAVSADPSSGKLTIGWDYEGKDVPEAYSESQTYSIWRSDGVSFDLSDDNLLTAICIKTGVRGFEFEDNTFSEVPGTDMVQYYVVPESGVNNVRYEDDRPFVKRGGGGYVYCRHRAGLCLGLSQYDRTVPGLETLEGHQHDAEEAELVESLLGEGDGEFDSLCDWRCKWDDVTNTFHRLSEDLKPGDIFFFYIATHGNTNFLNFANQTCTDKPVHALYDRIVSSDDVRDLLKKEGLKKRGIKFIGIVNTCYSGDFVREFENDSDFDNTAWIASSGVRKLAACGDWYSHFGTFFIDWGWNGRNAKRRTVVGLEGSPVATASDDDAQMNLYEIGKYAGLFLLGQKSYSNEDNCNQGVTLIHEEILRSTDVVNDIGEVPCGEVPSRPEFDVEQDYRGVKIVPRLPEGEEDAFALIEWANDVWLFGYKFCEWDFYKPCKKNYDGDFDVYGRWNFTEKQAAAYSRWVDYGVKSLYGTSDVVTSGQGIPGSSIRVGIRSLLPGGWSERGENKSVRLFSDEEVVKGFSEQAKLYFEAKLECWAPDDLSKEKSVKLMSALPTNDRSYRLKVTPAFRSWGTLVSAAVSDEEGNLVCAYTTTDVREGTDGTNSWYDVVFRSSMKDLGELRVRMTLTVMSGTLGAYSFAGYSAVPKDCQLFDPSDKVFWPENVTLGGRSEYELPSLPELPQVREEDLILTISFDAGFQGESPAPITCRYGEPYGKLPVPKCTKDGYRFDRWAGMSDYIDENDIAVSSGTLFAQWTWVGSGGDSGDDDDDPQGIDGLEGEYGPFVPGVVYTNDFSGIVSSNCKVTGLPKGMKWVPKSCAVIGAAEKPSTNVVTFSASYTGYGWTFKDEETALFIVGPLPKMNVVSIGETNGCKVTGGGTYQANKKVTLKATAGKGCVFSGWYDGEVLVSRLSSYALTMPPHDLTLCAKFIAQTDDVAAVSFTLPAELTNGVTAVNVPVDVSGCTSLSTVKVTGLPTGLKFTAKALDVKASKGKPAAHYEANTIYGTPTKSGVYTVVATVTTAGKKTASASQTVVVRKPGECVVKAEVPAIDGVVPGKVTGMGVYAKGKKVTLKATANKGYVFAGWYGEEGLGGLGGLVTQAASYSFTMPTNDVAYVAKFVTTGEDKASITASVNGMDLSGTSGETPLPHCETNVMAGVYLEWPVAASAHSLPTVKVAGLPSGLKFTAKPITKKVTSGTGASRVTTVVTNVPANTIYGAPTKASTVDKNGNVTPSKVKVTVTTAGKSKAEYVIDLTVDPLPPWAIGEFSGLASTAEGRRGSASMSVTAAGKVSGKVIVNGTNCTFSAASYDITSTTVGETNLVAVVTGKLGKEAAQGGIAVVASGSTGTFAGAKMSLFRNVWKDKGAEPVPEDAQGLYTVKLGADDRGTGYLSLTVDKKGAVKVAGKAPDGTALSGSATLVPAVDPEGAAYYFADVFCAPSAYKGGYVAGRLSWDADGQVSSDGLDWTSFNPQSTADYYAGGFVRTLDCSGAKYDKKALLPDLGYGTLALSAFGVREELFITVDQTGKKFVVADKGDAKLTFSFTQSTGIWKGSYLMWPDPSSTKSVKVSFEGILVSGEEDLKGFGTYDATSSYPTYNKKGEQTGKKSYKYKESVPVDFVDIK